MRVRIDVLVVMLFRWFGHGSRCRMSYFNREPFPFLTNSLAICSNLRRLWIAFPPVSLLFWVYVRTQLALQVQRKPCAAVRHQPFQMQCLQIPQRKEEYVCQHTHALQRVPYNPHCRGTRTFSDSSRWPWPRPVFPVFQC